MNDGLNILPPLREVIRTYDLAAKKSLGQNFLLDLNLTRRIARSVPDLDQLNVIEIGPGPGGLTRAVLLEGAKSVIAIERDTRAITALQDVITAANGRLRVIEGDALEFDATSLCDQPRAIVANLPYNIATPLLIGWLKKAHDFSSLTLMFQKEVADRLLAEPGTKSYGRLSVMAQWKCLVRGVLTLPPQAFTPPPKIDSTVVRLTPHACQADVPWDIMEKLVQAAFSQRRKMLRSTLKHYAPEMQAAGIDPTLRAENLSVDDYVRIAEQCA